MHKWFEKLGVPSYNVELKGGFELDYSAILESSKTFEKLSERLSQFNMRFANKTDFLDYLWGD